MQCLNGEDFKQSSNTESSVLRFQFGGNKRRAFGRTASWSTGQHSKDGFFPPWGACQMWMWLYVAFQCHNIRPEYSVAGALFLAGHSDCNSAICSADVCADMFVSNVYLRG